MVTHVLAQMNSSKDPFGNRLLYTARGLSLCIPKEYEGLRVLSRTAPRPTKLDFARIGSSSFQLPGHPAQSIGFGCVLPMFLSMASLALSCLTNEVGCSCVSFRPRPNKTMMDPVIHTLPSVLRTLGLVCTLKSVQPAKWSSQQAQQSKQNVTLFQFAWNTLCGPSAEYLVSATCCYRHGGFRTEHSY